MIDQKIIEAVQESHAKFYSYGPFVSVTLAQWAVESGWGRHVSGVNNYFGIKANEAQIKARHATQRLTNEYIHGVKHQKEQWFANYDTLEEGISAHSSLLLTPHYKACQEAHTPQDYCHALQACGYATAPNYAAVLISVIKAFDLQQYDKMPHNEDAKQSVESLESPEVSEGEQHES